MTDLTPEFCPHCLTDFAKDLVEIKTSNPPKCGRCLLPLWWEDRSGRLPDRPWPCYTLLANLRAGRYDAVDPRVAEALRDLEESERTLREVVRKLEALTRLT